MDQVQVFPASEAKNNNHRQVIMRQQSKEKVIVRGRAIGGPLPLICLPLVAKNSDSLLRQANELIHMQPDLLEWRIDDYQKVTAVTDCLAVLEELRTVIADIPLIFTCRIDREGGLQKIPQEKRLELISAAMASGNVDIVDIELCNEKDFIETVRKKAAANGVKLILSHHNFSETPTAELIYTTLVKAQKMGADIAKLAAMPKDYTDVLTLMSATNKARNEGVEVPMVTIAMGPEGKITRLAGGLFGSDITFAVGRESSAPGQIPINELRMGMALLYGAD
jgi:3-dehydroquinate dehydratase-1